MGVPKKIWLFRMVHWQNVAYILENGICCQSHPKADPNYINIGHQQLISDRQDYSIPFPDAGDLGEYVPFYFAGHSPMLYIIMHGFRGVKQLPQRDIVFIALSFETVKAKQLEFLFSDRNAKIAIANFYNHENDFDKINWEIVQSKDWANTENNFNKRDLKQAEFLIRNQVPIHCIKNLVVKTLERKKYFEKIIDNLALDIKVHFDNTGKLYY
jgi:hypothetical protein